MLLTHKHVVPVPQVALLCVHSTVGWADIQTSLNPKISLKSALAPETFGLRELIMSNILKVKKNKILN